MSDLMTETEARPTESPPDAGDGNGAGAGAGAGTGTVAPPRELEDLAGELIAGVRRSAGAA